MHARRMRLTDQMRSDLRNVRDGRALSPQRARPLIKRGLVVPDGSRHRLTDKGSQQLAVG